jgi:hypothetical protein
MELKAVFADGTYILGDRKFIFSLTETKGTHMLLVKDSSPVIKGLIGSIVSIPIDKPMYWVIRK